MDDNVLKFRYHPHDLLTTLVPKRGAILSPHSAPEQPHSAT